jgi:hypothetical protein
MVAPAHALPVPFVHLFRPESCGAKMRAIVNVPYWIGFGRMVGLWQLEAKKVDERFSKRP